MLRFETLSGCRLAVALSATVFAANAFGQACEGQWLPGYGVPGVNGSVNAMTLWDPDGAGPLPEMLVIGGSFTMVDKTPATNIAAWNGETWIPLGDGVRGASSISGVNALAVYGGKLYAGGVFEQAGAIATRNIASWNGSTWEALGPGMSGTGAVNAMTVYQGELVVGGAFSITGGYSRVAKWDGSAWSILGVSNVLDDTARAMTVFGDKLVVGGDFATANGKFVSGIASWDGTNWQGLGSGMSPGGSVRSLRSFQGKLYAGGSFMTAGGQLSPYLARWTGNAWEWAGAPFASGPFPQSVNAMTETAGELLVGGELNNSSAVFSYDGQSWSAVGAIGVAVRSLQTFGQTLYAGSQGSGVKSGPGIWVYQNDQWQVIADGFNDQIDALAVYNNELVVGGRFQQAPGVEAATVAKWSGVNWRGFGAQSISPLLTLRNQGGVLFAGGRFTPPAAPSKLIARWSGSAWESLGQALPTTAGSSVQTLGEYQDKLLVAGDLPGAPDSTLKGVWLWDGSQWQSLGAVFQIGYVKSAAVYKGDLYVSGPSLRLVSDSASGTLLRYNGTTWSRFAQLGLSSNDIVLRVYQDKLYIGSADVRTTSAGSFGPLASWDGTTLSRVGLVASVAGISSMTEYHGDLIVGGSFANAFGVGANGVVRWNGTSFAALGQGISGSAASGSSVTSLEVFNNELIVGGGFTIAGGAASAYFARWTDEPLAWTAVQPESRPVNGGLTLTLSATPASGYSNVTFQWKRNGADVVDGAGGASVGGGLVSGASGVLASPTDGTSVQLTIGGVQASDAGSYTVVFTTACGGSSSEPAIVTVNACPSDLSGDSLVDTADFTIFVSAYDTLDCNAPEMPAWCPSDLNGDGVVDDADFSVFVRAYDAMVCP